MILKITETSQAVCTSSSLQDGWVVNKEWLDFIFQSEGETVRGTLKQRGSRGEVA